MSKRNPGLEQRPRNFWPTPPEAVEPLLKVLSPGTEYVEPCAGDGALIRALKAAGHRCIGACDLLGRPTLGITEVDARTVRWVGGGRPMWITNPPWDFASYSAILDNLLTPTGAVAWFLLPADQLHNQRFARFIRDCSLVVSIGRVQWIADSKHKGGYENSCWYRFERGSGPPRCLGRIV